MILFFCLFCLGGLIFAQPSEKEPETRFLVDANVPRGATAEDIVCILCSADVQGHVTGDVILIGGNANIVGLIDGDVIVVGGWIRTRGSIGGEAFSLGGIITRESGGQIKGELESFPWLHLPGQRSFHPAGVLSLVGAVFLCVFAAGLVWKREASNRLADRLIRRWWLALIVGAGVWFLYLEYLDEYETSAILLEFVFWVLLLLLFSATWFGSYGLAWTIGRKVSGNRAWKTRLAGALTLSVGLLIPVLGLAVVCLLFILGLGAGLLFTWPAIHPKRTGKTPAVAGS